MISARKPDLSIIKTGLITSQGLEIVMKDFMEKVKGFFRKVGSYIKKGWSVSGAVAVAYIKKGFAFLKKYWDKGIDWISTKTQTKKFKMVMDKCTTGLLIFLMFSPILILGYIFLWFVINIS